MKHLGLIFKLKKDGIYVNFYLYFAQQKYVQVSGNPAWGVCAVAAHLLLVYESSDWY